MNHGRRTDADGGTNEAALQRTPPSETPSVLRPPFCASAALLVILLVLLSAPLRSPAQSHAHISSGAVGQAQNDPLFFANGGGFTTNSGYVVTLAPRTNGPYAGHFEGTVSFTALSGDIFTGGPDAGHAALGSQIQMQVVSVDGPPGSRFGFWETPGDEIEGTVLTWSLPTGTRNGTNTFPVSENLGELGADPYGHIHGRHYSATHAGLHTVGFRLVDAGRNGAVGGAIHTPSEVLYLHFQAGVTISGFTRAGTNSSARFGTQSGSTYHLESSSTPGGTGGWATVAGPFTGNQRLQSAALASTNAVIFHRLRRTTP
jgi:hypothetical protein